MMEKLNIEEIIKNLTIEEKIKMLTGSSPMNNYAIERIGLPSLNLNDGPNGLRMLKKDGNSLGGISSTYKSSVFACPSLLSSTWNKQLIYDVGEAISEECLFYGTNILLGPAVNIKRNPLCGRNFEYYSEDPFLTGYLASNFINGVESNNVAACVKHFACNNNEKFRFFGNSKIDLKALNEIYLKPYKIILKNTNISCFMTAYNKLNDEHCCQNKYLLNEFLRKENKFEGIVMTDWGGILDRVESIQNTLDLEMPGEVEYNMNYLLKSVKDGTLSEEVINNSIRRLLNIYNKTIYVNKKHVDIDIFEKNYRLAIKTAEEGIVLLKNNDVLPLNLNNRYLIIGDMFENNRYQGSGSSLLNPYKFISIKDVFDNEKVSYKYLKGYDQFNEKNYSYFKKLKNSLELDKNYSKILLFLGQNDFVESEGFDRENLKLPKIQLEIIDELVKYNIPIIVILSSGSVIELPFKDKVDGILDLFLAGEGIGQALFNVIFGKISPSGRLSETFVKKYDDVLFSKEFSLNPITYYKESIFVGYRYYDTYDIDVCYPFGYGLSYTSFSYGNLVVNLDLQKQLIDLNFDLKNDGNYDSKEVIQVYIGKKDSLLLRAKKELKAFEKIYLKVGEQKNISIKIPLDELKIFDPYLKSWILEEGNYQIYICKNVRDIILTSNIYIEGLKVQNNDFSQLILQNYKKINDITDKNYCEIFNIKYVPQKIYKKPYTMETPIYAYKTLVGRIFRNCVLSVGKKQIKKAKKIKDPIQRNREIKAGLFITKLMPVNTLRSLSFSSSGGLKYETALALLEIINGHYIKGIKKLIKKGDR